MSDQQNVSLSRGEYEVVKKLAEAGVSEGYIDEISRLVNINETTLYSLIPLLAEKGLAIVKEISRESYLPTDKGKEVLEKGFPEERLIKLLEKEGGEISLYKVREVLGKEAGIAVGQAKRKNYIIIIDNKIKLRVDPDKAYRELSMLKRALQEVFKGGVSEPPVELVKRGLLKKHITKRVYFKLTMDPRTIISKAIIEVSKLTHEIISSGLWRNIKLKAYDVLAQPPEIYPARKHFLGEFIEMLRDIMKELGFIEVRGPLIDVELFNFDILFQAQDHPAREIHDTLRVKKPKKLPLNEYVDLIERVSKIHERGWGYKWNPDIAARVLLRSQTTAVSARILVTRPKPPIRYFTLGRVFRSDVVDATHLPEFHQLDGIMGWPGYNFRDLIGILREVASRLNLQLKLKPGYFPFTEPSVEGYVRLPNGKWLELFGAGLFRPEVLEATGVDYPVGAWGFGVERLAAAYYGVTDIRDLYTKNIELLKRFPVRTLRW